MKNSHLDPVNAIKLSIERVSNESPAEKKFNAEGSFLFVASVDGVS